MVHYDPFSAEVMEDPLPVYAKLRAEAPVYKLDKYDAWAISRFEDVWTLSSEPSLSVASGTTPSQVLTKVQPVTPMLNLMDPPEHTKLRVELRRFLQPKSIGHLEPIAREIVKQSLDEALPTGRIDVLGEFGMRLSVQMACRAVGIPLEDAALMASLVNRFFGREPGVEGMTADGLAAAGELIAYFMNLVATREKTGDAADDVVNKFRHVEVGGRKLAPEEIASHLSMLIIGGSETFPKTLANVMRRLAEHPEQRAWLRENPAGIPEAFREGLRFDMPTQFLCRTVTKPLEVGGQKLMPGQGVLFLYASANRDALEFPNPDVFDIQRRAARILSFGAGIHTCIGLHVAQMEARVCLEEALRRMPDWEVDWAQSERLRTEFVQGFAKMTVSFRPS
ncbi:MAG: cytochrome P450 [Myxococcota bacterium]|jgi:cytochrome P450|nr:cytochrome P450 [Myxococcota bacterium]